MNQGYQPYYFNRDLSAAKRQSRTSAEGEKYIPAIFNPDGVEPLPPSESLKTRDEKSEKPTETVDHSSLDQADEVVDHLVDQNLEELPPSADHAEDTSIAAAPPSNMIHEDVVEQRIQEAREAALQEGEEKGLKIGLEQGKEEAQKAYHDQNEEAGLQILEKIERELVKLALAQDNWFGRYASDVTDLVSAIMKRLMPLYTEKFGSQEIAAFVQQVLSMVVDKPRLEILLPPRSADMAAEIKALMNKAGAGLTVDIGNEPVTIRVDDELQPGECVVRWQGGSIERRMDGFWDDIDRAIDRIRSDMTQETPELTG